MDTLPHQRSIPSWPSACVCRDSTGAMPLPVPRPPLHLHLLVLLLLLLQLLDPAAALQQVVFSVVEEQPEGTAIGSLTDKFVFSAAAGDFPAAPSGGGGGGAEEFSFGIIPDKGDRSSGASFVDLSARGDLRVRRRIDRDSIDRCDRLRPCLLAFQAFRFGGGGGAAQTLHTTIDVRIAVLDLNDNAPTWSRYSLEATLNENHPVGEAFKVAAARDPDFGRNGTVAYQLLDPTDTFVIAEDGRQSYENPPETISLYHKKPLDRETIERYNLTLVARDLALEPRTASISLFIIVEDANDHQPSFNQSVYRVYVPETTSHRRPILQLFATDPDKGRNGEVEFDFADGVTSQVRMHFRLDRISGQLFLRQALDYDVAETRLFEFSVVAKDRAPIPRSSVAQVVIVVLDENDCSPLFTVYQFSKHLGMRETSKLLVPEDAVPQSLLGIASVVDNDSGPGGDAACDIQGPMRSLFRLNQLPEKPESRQKTYQIVSRDRFDRELQSSYQVPVMCHDNGSPSLSSSYNILVDIQDVNDEKPVFSPGEYEFRVRENLPALSHVGSVTATDRDAMQNGRVAYEIDAASSPDARLFRITAQGEVQTTEPLDREHKDLLTFTVIARDHGSPSLNASAPVAVRVLDDNDNEPRFGQSSYAFEVFENEAPDAPVGNLTAWDDDADSNAKLTFAIVPLRDHSVPFRVVTLYEGLAQIRTTAVIDRESGQLLDSEKSFIFAVRATDRGARPNTGSCMVKVVVKDRNDNSPKWIVPSDLLKSVNVSRHRPVGQAFIHLKAIDLDEGEFGRVRYSIRAGDTDGAFALDQNAGGLQLRRQLPHAREYLLSLQATDCPGCNFSHSSPASLRVFVVDQPSDSRRDERRGGGDEPGRRLPTASAGDNSNERIIVWLVSCTAGIALMTVCGILVARCLLFRMARREAASAEKRQQQQQQQQRQQLLAVTEGPRPTDSLLFTERPVRTGGGSGSGGLDPAAAVAAASEAKKFSHVSGGPGSGGNTYQGVASTLSSRAWQAGGTLMSRHHSHQHPQHPQPLHQQYTTLAPVSSRRVPPPQYCEIGRPLRRSSASEQPLQPLRTLGLRPTPLLHHCDEADSRSHQQQQQHHHQASSFV